MCRDEAHSNIIEKGAKVSHSEWNVMAKAYMRKVFFNGA